MAEEAFSPRVSLLKEDTLGDSEPESSPLTPHRKVPAFPGGSFDEISDGLGLEVVPGGPRSQSEINLMNSDNENDPGEARLLFVPQNATAFGLGVSSSDTQKAEDHLADGLGEGDETPSLPKPGIKLQVKATGAKFSGTDSEKHPILPSSPSKSEDSSGEDFPSSSVEPVMSVSAKSEDAVCSKYSQLSEECSVPSSPMKAPQAGSNGVDVSREGGETAQAFSSLVELEAFREEQDKIPSNRRVQPGSEPKTEDQVLTLLKSGSKKGVKAFLRKSQYPVESPGRHNLWYNVCKELLGAQGSMYQQMKTQDCPSLPPMVDTDYCYQYYLSPTGVSSVVSVLDVVHQHHPDITHCPLLYPLTALFLHYMSAEHCCDCMQALLRSKKPIYLSQTRPSAQAAKWVLRDLAKKYTKKSYDLISASTPNMEAILDQWLVWIFHDLPFQYMVRVVDSFLLEGYKVLYRVTLAIVQLYAKHHPPKGPVTAHDISVFCQDLPCEPRKLIKEAFAIKRLGRREIQRLSVHHHDLLRLAATEEPQASPAAHRTFTQGMGLLKDPDTETVLTPDMLNTIWGWIPERVALKRLTQLYTTEEHGFHLRTLYTRSEIYEPTLMVIRTTKDEMFGAYCATAWQERHEVNKGKMSYFGRGETFVFTLRPEVKLYPWVALVTGDQKSSDLFQAGDEHMMFVGSGNGNALCLDAELRHCHSMHCDTFDNQPLCSGQDFSCQHLEVFGFVD